MPYLPTYLQLSLYSRKGLVPTSLASSHLVPYLPTYLHFRPFELCEALVSQTTYRLTLLYIHTYHLHLCTLQRSHLVPYSPLYSHFLLLSFGTHLPTTMEEVWVFACFGEGHTLSLSLSQRVDFSVVFVFLAFARGETCIFGE